jgi:hypothetical protein
VVYNIDFRIDSPLSQTISLLKTFLQDKSVKATNVARTKPGKPSLPGKQRTQKSTKNKRILTKRKKFSRVAANERDSRKQFQKPRRKRPPRRLRRRKRREKRHPLTPVMKNPTVTSASARRRTRSKSLCLASFRTAKSVTSGSQSHLTAKLVQMEA